MSQVPYRLRYAARLVWSDIALKKMIYFSFVYCPISDGTTKQIPMEFLSDFSQYYKTNAHGIEIWNRTENKWIINVIALFLHAFFLLMVMLICHLLWWVRYPVWQHTFVSPSAFSRRAVVSYWRKYVHEVLVNSLGGLSLPRKNVVRLTDRPHMALVVYRGRKNNNATTTTNHLWWIFFFCW